MKLINHFEQNRPVHLARRDVFFEHAATRISAQQKSFSHEISFTDYEEILFLLRVARQHARFSVRESAHNESDSQFCTFINLLAGNVKAVLSMMNLKGMVDNNEGSFFRFLGANQASIALLAEEYQRRANDIVRSIHNTLKLAEEPFETIKAENAAHATEDERQRYNKARNHFEHLVEEGKHWYIISRNARRANPF